MMVLEKLQESSFVKLLGERKMFLNVLMKENGKIVMPIKLGLKIKKSMFHKTAKELRAFAKENDIKLLKLLEYLRRRNNKKVRKETINVKSNS